MSNNRSLNTLIIVITVAISSFFFIKEGKNSEIFYGDAFGYYMYLPATFIYHNHTAIYDLPKDKGINSLAMWCIESSANSRQYTPKGYQLNQYTLGVAFMESPFFLIAHMYEKARGLPANGYSDSYSNMMKLGGMVYTLLGLLLIYKILRRYCSATLSLMTVCSVFIGTNLFWFTLYQAGMAHVPLFFLYALLMYLTMKVYDNPKWYLFACTGLVIGMIALIRPTDIVCVLIPLLYPITNKTTLLAKVAFIKQHFGKIILLCFCACLPIIPQLIYWKMLTGHFVYYSYGQQRFYWSDPRIIEGIFHYNNGWLVYSPIMYFALIGLLLIKPFQSWKFVLWFLLPVYIYIIYSWFCCFYPNGLGSRPMLHMYPLLALPVAAFIRYVSGRKWVLKGITILVSVLFIAINLSYSMQQAKGILNSEESNMAYNMGIMFRMHLTYDDLVTKDVQQKQPKETDLTKLATLACLNFKDSLSSKYVRDTSAGNSYIYRLKDDQYADTIISVTYDADKYKNAKWLKCSGRFKISTWPGGYYRHVIVLEVKRGEETISWTGCKIDNKIGHAEGNDNEENIILHRYKLNEWGTVYFYSKIPKNIENGDKIRMYIDNASKEEIFMDDLCLESYK